MRILGRNPAEIVPHAAYGMRDLGFRKLRQGAADVESGALGNAEPGANTARQRAADGRRPIERQQPERAKAQPRAPALHAMNKADPLVTPPGDALTRLSALGGTKPAGFGG